MERIVPLKGEGDVVKQLFRVALILSGWLVVGPRLGAQNQPNNNTNSPAANQPKNANPFPEDESTIPVLPSGNTPQPTPGTVEGTVLPAGDVDPVESPDDQRRSDNSGSGFSSSVTGVDSLVPAPADEPPSKADRRKDQGGPEFQESAKEDENVGKYYLDNKDWRAALSRYQSAMVLDPDNPDIYWGLAESDRHLGHYADARTYYLKVMEYDPDSKLAKEARKALHDPELVNAKPAAGEKFP
jgi:tetratricopeptide (TPR) repeat protein